MTKRLEDYLYYEEKAPDLKIYHGDCLEIMPLLPKVDLVVTDPPYGVNFEGNEWDAEIQMGWFEPAIRLSKYLVLTPGNGNQTIYPKPIWTLCWARPGSVQRVRVGTGFSHWEPVLVYGESNPYQVDFKQIPAQTNSSHWGHPCPKPLILMKWLIEESKTEGLILDTFLGSGTTLVACKELNRNGIGIEINEKYCEIAKKRLRATCKPLFTDVSGAKGNSKENDGQKNTLFGAA